MKPSLFHSLLFPVGVVVSTLIQSEPLRLNQAQVIGTHNSYHIAPHPSLIELMERRNPGVTKELAYTHRPLREQLEHLGIRQLELDIYVDPVGGRYAHPKGRELVVLDGLPPVPEHDVHGQLDQPGFKIIHALDVDFLTTVLTLRDALEEIRQWSSANPLHFPIFVLLELKEDAVSEEGTQALSFSGEHFAALDQEIGKGIPAGQLLTPTLVRGKHSTLREAILKEGWPSLDSCRGKILFALDNEGPVRDRYLEHMQSSGVMFVSVDAEHDQAGWMKMNDPIGQFQEIQRMVQMGFLVRTRADAGTKEARDFDFKRLDAALRSGAQFISTDYPEPDLSLSPYAVRLPGGVTVRANPVTVSERIPEDVDLEGFQRMTDSSPELLQKLNAMAIQFHTRRRLLEASELYQKVLELDPPGTVSTAERELALRLAPILLTHAEEPLPLRDVAVVFHPTLPVVGYHLFWQDDIDFPEDNDPVDHEVVWVAYEQNSGEPSALHCYFHGSILYQSLTTYPRVGVEWGKHGSLPLDGLGNLVLHPDNLKRHWFKLSTVGIRVPEHPFARTWPKRFEDDYQGYCRLDTPAPIQKLIREKQMMVKTRWANAALDQILLPYNFSAKVEWPNLPHETD